MLPLSPRERAAVAVLGYGGAVALLALHRPWELPHAVWEWLGVGAAVALLLSAVLGRRGVAVAAAFAVAAAPWDFAYPLVLPFVALGIVLLVRRSSEVTP